MTVFSNVIARGVRKPPRTLPLPPSAFADTWDDRPAEPVMVGLRVVSEGDLQDARCHADKKASGAHPHRRPGDPVWNEAFNQALMHYAVAAGTCHPDNVDEPYWQMAFDVVPLALSFAGTTRLYDEIEALQLEDSPTSPETNDDEVRALARRLSGASPFESVRAGDARFARRMLRRILDMLPAEDG